MISFHNISDFFLCSTCPVIFKIGGRGLSGVVVFFVFRFFRFFFFFKSIFNQKRPFLLSFFFQDIESVYALEHSMQIQVMKPFGQHSHTVEDVSDAHTLWQYIDMSLIPTMVNHKDQVSFLLCESFLSVLSLYLSLSYWFKPLLKIKLINHYADTQQQLKPKTKNLDLTFLTFFFLLSFFLFFLNETTSQ
jgi:hypothetical protein